jgi:hypothetical protein
LPATGHLHLLFRRFRGYPEFISIPMKTRLPGAFQKTDVLMRHLAVEIFKYLIAASPVGKQMIPVPEVHSEVLSFFYKSHRNTFPGQPACASIPAVPPPMTNNTPAHLRNL